MIYKYTKCESVIAKIMADSNMQEKNMRITDIREWIFEAVEKIGAPVQYVQKESGEDCVPIFEIHEHQVPIPEDLKSLTTNKKQTKSTVTIDLTNTKDLNVKINAELSDLIKLVNNWGSIKNKLIQEIDRSFNGG